MQPRVLDRRRLEPGEGLASLLVLLGHLLAGDHAHTDDDRLHDDDREIEGPTLGRLRKPGDERIHEEGGGADADERERHRPKDRGVEEAADHEDEERGLAHHEDRRQDQDPDEEDEDAPVVGPPGRRHPRVEHVDPCGRDRGDRERRQPPGRVRRRRGVPRPAQDAQDRRDREQHIAADVDHPVAEPLPARLRRPAHAATLLQTGDAENQVRRGLTPIGTIGPRACRARA